MRKFTVSASALEILFTVSVAQNNLFAQAHQKGRYLDTTCEFGGRVGKVVFKNNSAYPINVKLWHPDSGQIHTSQTVPGNASTDFGINVGDDWGVQLGSSQIRCIGAVAGWANNIFMVNSSSFY